ncbi:MAG: ribbon-helix-helix protein, CopG family [Candidatus Bathyarchaeia archaeon]
MEQVSIRLPKQIVEKLQRIASDYNITVSALVRIILSDFIRIHETIGVDNMLLMREIRESMKTQTRQ